MTELEKLLQQVLAVRDTPAARTLVLDCWLHAQKCGEQSGLVWGQMLLQGVTRYQEHERATRQSQFYKVDNG